VKGNLITEGERAVLDNSAEKAITVLREMLDDLRVRPLSIPAQVLERRADRSEGKHLGNLLDEGEMLGDANAAALELKAAVAKLAEQAIERRIEALEAKSRTTRSEAQELQEFQRLMRQKAGRKIAPGGTSSG